MKTASVHIIPSQEAPPDQLASPRGGHVSVHARYENLVREILAELVTPPILAFPNRDAVADGLRLFHVYSDACIDGFGAALEQGQSDGSMKPIAYISRATLDSEKYWTPLDFEAGKHRLGSQTPPRLTSGNHIPNILQPQGIGKHRQSGEP